jgi:hypothetical protein
MAARTIGLEIRIDGISKTVSSIKELEGEISKLQDRLKGVAIGSDEFNRLQGELRSASGELENFNKQSEGLSLERQLEAVGKFTGGITAGFAAATAASQLFGAETETQEEITKAATTAQNLMTVALGARAIGETLVGANTLIQTAATKASTVATNLNIIATRSLTANLRALGVVLKSNIWGIALAGLAALAAAFVLTSDETDKADQSLEKYLDTLQNTNDLIERLKLIDESTLLTLEKEGASQERLNQEKLKQLNIQKQLLEQTRQQIINDQTKLRTELNSTNQDERKKELKEAISKLEEDFQTTQNQILATDNAITRELINQTNEKKKQSEEQKRLRQEIAFTNEELRIRLLDAGPLRELAELELQYEKDLIALQNNRQGRLRREEIFNKEKKLIQDEFNRDFKKFVDDSKISATEFDKSQADLLIKQEERRQQLGKFFKDYYALSTITGPPDTTAEINAFEQLTIVQTEELNDLILKNRIENLKAINDANEKFGKENLDQQIKLYNAEFDEFKKSTEQKLAAEIFYNLRLQKEKELGRQLTREEIKEIQSLVIVERAYISERLENLRKLGQERLKLASEITQAEKKSIEQQTQDNKKYFEDLLRLQETYKNDREKLNTEIVKLDNQRKVTDLQTEQKLVNEKIRIYEKYNQDLASLQQRRTTLEGRLAGFTGPVIEGVTPTEEIEAARKELERVKKAINEYVGGIIDPQELEKLKVRATELQTAINTATNVQPVDEKFQKTLGNIQTYLQAFSNAINTIGQLTQTQFSMQLEGLENEYQKTMDNIVGDTVEANAKREEAEKIFQAKKKQIEKQARISQLQSTLVQTIASAAQAVVSTLANPSLGPAGKAIIIGIEGILATAQISLIRQQIAQAQALRRGGKIKKQMATGGMVVGPSHEQGGVNFGSFELEGGESVINRQSSLNYGGLLSSINQAGGGRPIINNVLDSRLVEILAKGRQEPIRAYVFESDITNAQTINRKLEQLTTL